MSPLFVTAEVQFEDIGEHMQRHIIDHDLSKKPRKLLVGGIRAKKMLITTPLLKYYLSLGMEVSRVYQVVEYGRKACFKKFVDFVANRRREADRDPKLKVLGENAKLIGNILSNLHIKDMGNFSYQSALRKIYILYVK